MQMTVLKKKQQEKDKRRNTHDENDIKRRNKKDKLKNIHMTIY